MAKKREKSEFIFNPQEALAGTEAILEIEDIEQLRFEIAKEINKLLSGEKNSICFPKIITDLLTREEIEALENKGVNFASYSDNHPNGGLYVKDYFHSSLEKSIAEKDSSPLIIINNIAGEIYATGFLSGTSGLITHPPILETPEELSGLKRMPMNSMAVAVHSGENWSKTHILPDGKFVLPGFDCTAIQYSQAAFEGMVVSRDGDKLTVFRPEENAERFQNSCRKLIMPEIPIEQFLESVKACAQNNKKFIKDGGKLYIRPFMMGLNGGTGVKPAQKYIFAIEASPYGEYMKVEDSEDPVTGIDVKVVKMERPSFGKDKVAGNYAPTFPPKVEAFNEGFNDILLVTKIGVIQECSSCNVFFIKKEADKFIFRTPSTMDNILPGITRKSLITLLRDPEIQKELGVTIDLMSDYRLNQNMIQNMHGAFGTGTAAGITKIKRFQMQHGENIIFEDQETYQLIDKIYNLLQKLRRGEIEGYEDWVMEI